MTMAFVMRGRADMWLHRSLISMQPTLRVKPYDTRVSSLAWANKKHHKATKATPTSEDRLSPITSGKRTWLWKIAMSSGKTRFKWPLSTAMSVYQSVADRCGNCFISFIIQTYPPSMAKIVRVSGQISHLGFAGGNRPSSPAKARPSGLFPAMQHGSFRMGRYGERFAVPQAYQCWDSEAFRSHGSRSREHSLEEATHRAELKDDFRSCWDYLRLESDKHRFGRRCFKWL